MPRAARPRSCASCASCPRASAPPAPGFCALCSGSAPESPDLDARPDCPCPAFFSSPRAYFSAGGQGLPERYKCVREREVERRQEEGLPMNLSYEAITHMLDPFYCTYFCKVPQ